MIMVTLHLMAVMVEQYAVVIDDCYGDAEMIYEDYVVYDELHQRLSFWLYVSSYHRYYYHPCVHHDHGMSSTKPSHDLLRKQLPGILLLEDAVAALVVVH